MKIAENDNILQLDTTRPIWSQTFMVAPLVVVGTKEADGYDMAPKHMASPIGFDNYFGFVCTPKHATYGNIKKAKEFTVSFPLPRQVIITSLSASPRCDTYSKLKNVIGALQTVKAPNTDALFIKDSYLYFECKLFKIIDGFNENSILIGEIKTAYVDKKYMKTSEKDEQQQLMENPLLAYIAYGRFAKITETFKFPFPKNFKR